MPILPGFIERLALRLNKAPAPLLDAYAAVGFRILVAAVRLGVFPALAERPLTAPELAARLGTGERGTAALLTTLEALGYVEQRGERFANTKASTAWLTPGGESDFSPYLRYWGTALEERFDDLEDTIRRDAPAENLYAWLEQRPEASSDFQTGLVAIARLMGNEVARKLKLPASAKRLLDIGGGHGMYAIAICHAHPQLSATVFDSPQALQTAEEKIAAEAMQARVVTQPGDFLRDDLGTGYDVALLFNIIHGLSVEENLTLLRRVHAALAPGGCAVVLEQLAGSTRFPLARAVARILGMSYFHLLGGRIYSYDDVAGWMRQAGFDAITRTDLLLASGNCLVAGDKRA